MIKKCIPFFATTLLLIGCANEMEEGRHANNQENNLQPIHYETPEGMDESLDQDRSIGQRGGYPQSDLDGLNAGDTNEKTMDRYTNEKTISISEHLQEQKFIKQAQVTETDDRIIIAVMLNNHSEQTSLEGVEDEVEYIKQEVEQFDSEKQVVVYTDNVYWNRMRNLNSNQFSSDGDIENILEDFFNTNE